MIINFLINIETAALPEWGLQNKGISLGIFQSRNPTG